MKFSITTIDPDTNQVVLTGVYEDETLRSAFAHHIFAMVKQLSQTCERSDYTGIEFETYELYHGIMSERDLGIAVLEANRVSLKIKFPVGAPIEFLPNDEDYAKHTIIRID